MNEDFHMEKGTVTSATIQVMPESGPPLTDDLLSTHRRPLSGVCIASVIFGILLATNMLCQLRVATESSGRGVLRCIRFHTWISLMCIPVICGDLMLLAEIHKILPPLLCGILDIMAPFLGTNMSFRGLAIALGRYTNGFIIHVANKFSTFFHFQTLLPLPG